MLSYYYQLIGNINMIYYTDSIYRTFYMTDKENGGVLHAFDRHKDLRCKVNAHTRPLNWHI